MKYSNSFLTLLTLLFVGLKLAGVGQVAVWSWWWVLSPLWLGWTVLLFLFLLLVLWKILCAMCTD